MGEIALQRGVIMALLLSAGLAGAAEGFTPVSQRPDEIRQLNRRALEQLPAGAVPSNGMVCVEAEVVPTETAQDVKLRQWSVDSRVRPINASTGLAVPISGTCVSNAGVAGRTGVLMRTVVATNAAVPVCADKAPEPAMPDRILNRRLSLDENKDSL